MTEEKKTKSSLDSELNFDDLGSGSAKKKPQKPKPEKKKDTITGYTKNKAGEVLTSGIILGIPIDTQWNPSGFELKDIMSMNSKEFIKWSAMVYPRDLSKYEEIFQDADKRIKMFWRIVTFHNYSLFQHGKTNFNGATKH